MEVDTLRGGKVAANRKPMENIANILLTWMAIEPKTFGFLQ